jgi:phytanoyl-CoA hydroxylase
MKNIVTPNGISVRVPEIDKEDPSKKFTLDQLEEAQKYYVENGYCIIRNIFSNDVCDRIRKLWHKEVKSFNGHIYRQATAKSEKNKYNQSGWVMNPILNLQSLNPRHHGELRKCATDLVLCAAEMRQALLVLLGHKPKIVQSMYFEGNSETWEHQDTYYLDAENLGTMVAAWVALEDIDADAGRFFICPKSHLIDVGRQSKSDNVATNHNVYIKKIVEIIKNQNMEIRAPKLNQGDVVFWNARTIHGSLASQGAANSRSSITLHAIPSDSKLLQLQTRLLDVPTEDIGGVDIWRPKDQQLLFNRTIKWGESMFPKAYYFVKKTLIKAMVK